ELDRHDRDLPRNARYAFAVSAHGSDDSGGMSTMFIVVVGKAVVVDYIPTDEVVFRTGFRVSPHVEREILVVVVDTRIDVAYDEVLRARPLLPSIDRGNFLHSVKKAQARVSLLGVHVARRGFHLWPLRRRIRNASALAVIAAWRIVHPRNHAGHAHHVRV